MAEIFPNLPGLGWTVRKTPVWPTAVFDAVSGREVRIGLRSYPRWKWTLTYDLLRSDAVLEEFQQVADFVNRHGGSRDEFLFRDQTDCFIAGQLIGYGDGATKVYQLVRTLHVYGFEEPLTAIDLTASTNVAYINRVAVHPDNFSISETGVLTFHEAPTDTYEISVDVNYLWPARFLVDEMDFDYILFHIWEAKKLELISILK